MSDSMRFFKSAGCNINKLVRPRLLKIGMSNIYLDGEGELVEQLGDE